MQCLRKTNEHKFVITVVKCLKNKGCYFLADCKADLGRDNVSIFLIVSLALGLFNAKFLEDDI